MEKAIIIRYCEIHLKGKNRSYFERMLQKNIEHALEGISHKMIVMHSRYVIEGFDQSDYGEIADRLKKVAGVHTFSCASVVRNDLAEIEAEALNLMSGKSGTFKVETNRADKHFTPDSMGVSRYLGGKILEKYLTSLKVEVKNPDYLLSVDIREDGKTFLFTDYERGLSGMPTGSAGKGLLLISGGIDSPVAGYLTAKRGMKISALHFHSFPYTGEAAKEKVIELSKQVAAYNGGIDLYVVSFTHIQEAIHEKCPSEYMITLMRRFMMRIAERLAKQIGAQCLITGESLGQVASQTIEGMTSSNAVVKEMPVLRPLVGFDKTEIVERSKAMGAFETSILPYEDCCTVFLPKHPLIRPKIELVEAQENKLDVEALIEEALSTLEIIHP